MTASLTPNRDTAKAALWWLFEGATIICIFANTTGAASPPSLNGPLQAWSDYSLSSSYDIYLTGGTVNFDAVDTDRAELPQLEIVVDFASSITYTDILLLALPAIDPGPSAPIYAAIPFVGVIHESSAVTVGATETKTYRVDLFSEWL